MGGLENQMLKQQVEELRHSLRMQSSAMQQMLDQLRVELEDNDDPEEALKLVKEFTK